MFEAIQASALDGFFEMLASDAAWLV